MLLAPPAAVKLKLVTATPPEVKEHLGKFTSEPTGLNSPDTGTTQLNATVPMYPIEVTVMGVEETPLWPGAEMLTVEEAEIEVAGAGVNVKPPDVVTVTVAVEATVDAR